MSNTAPTKILSPVVDRFVRFIGTSPDDAHNRRRITFFLICLFLAGIAYELIFVEKDAARLDLIKSFSSTIIWLMGIYVGGSVAAKAVGEPQPATAPPAA